MNFVKYICGFFIIGLIVSSCKKDSYLDSGTFAPVYDGTVLEYLNTRPELFDSLLKVIKLADLEDALDQDGVSFFAPPSFCIEKSVWRLNAYLYSQGRDTITDLAQVHPAVWREYLSMYILNDTYLLKDIPQLDTLNLNVFPGQGFVALGGQNMNVGVLYNDVVTKNSQGVEQVVTYGGYRQLYLSAVRGSANAGGSGYLLNAPVATSDLRTRNGVIHVLMIQRHSFGFYTPEFVASAYARL